MLAFGDATKNATSTSPAFKRVGSSSSADLQEGCISRADVVVDHEVKDDLLRPAAVPGRQQVDNCVGARDDVGASSPVKLSLRTNAQRGS